MKGNGRGTATATRDLDETAEPEPRPEPEPSTGRGGPDEAGDAADDLGGVLPLRLRLITLSFIQLFVQLALIRWLGAQVVYMSFYSNFVLLASFLGFGLGFLWAGSFKRTLYPFAPVLLGGLVAWVAAFNVPLKPTTDDIVFFETVEPESLLPRWAVLLILFVAVAAVATALGEGVARTFARFRALEAYKLDLIGSILGIVGFAVMSLLGARPLAWGLITAVLFLLTLPLGTRRRPGRPERTARWTAILTLPWRITGLTALALAGILLLMVPFVAEARNDDVTWSPYYRITHQENEFGGIDVDVNQIPHWTQIEAAGNIMYEPVYDAVADPVGGDVLIIGAGSGNDVSVALGYDADHIDAVEIDPKLMELAEEHHPDQPYSDPRVVSHVDDGRAFLERSNREWDRIILALPDSLALVDGQSAIRLESYLFTVEAMEAARDHLKPGGTFAMYNYYREDWLVDRYANTLYEVFDVPPCVSRHDLPTLPTYSVLVASDDPAAVDCADEDRWIREQVQDDYEAIGQRLPSPVVDDRPFPYVRDYGTPLFRDLSVPFLDERRIPPHYLLTGAGALVLSLMAILAILGPSGQLRSAFRYIDLFFMGVAFLLLETKNVTQFALLFGTTWFVNALVFLGVLVSILLAVAVSRRVTFKRPARLYGVLLGALAVAYVIPQSTLLALPVVPRFVAAVTLAFFPIFTANLVFTQRFKDTAKSTVAFGANLLGAMVGGLLEYMSLMTGFRGLLIVAAVVYGLAFLTGRKHLTPAAA